uniref:Uncharacterized protein n=1 Tax=Lactuca sativa TaxID=4236 RepID=A0A9R1XNQ0_LACSA|nr:hypothetical protein LSAT_V11C200069960 [Lactuca sativa]
MSHTKTILLKRVREIHPSYIPIQYPLFFIYGDDGYKPDIGQKVSSVLAQQNCMDVSLSKYKKADKLPTTYHIDKIISTEIPDQQTQLDLLNLVREFIFDGLCGLANKHSLCMKSVRCIIFFPKQNYDQTTTMDILCIDVKGNNHECIMGRKA